MWECLVTEVAMQLTGHGDMDIMPMLVVVGIAAWAK